MTDDLNQLFHDEATAYLKALNEGLFALETAQGSPPSDLLKELNRVAHSLKGAARSVGQSEIETIGHYLETIFDAAYKDNYIVTAHDADTLYDGLDLIQQQLDNQILDTEILANVIIALEALTLKSRQAEPHKLKDESSEFPVIQSKADTDLINIFWVEVSEHLATLNQNLIQLEMAQASEKETILREMNRVAHSLKGAARAVDYTLIETISNHMEEIFQAALNGDITVSADNADTLYDALDIIQNILSGNENDTDTVVTVLVMLEKLVFEQNVDSRDAPLAPNAPVPSRDKTPEMHMPPALMTTTVEMGRAGTQVMRLPDESLRVAVNKLDQLMADTSELLVMRMQAEQRQQHLHDLRREHATWLREWRSVRAAYIRLVRRLQDDNDDLIPELSTLFRFLETNQRRLTDSNRQLAALERTLAQDTLQLSSLADQLQDKVSGLRMMPFDSVIGTFQRVARDMARDVGKQIHLEFVGAAVEIDKTVLDALSDPLMHLLRNAIDHGLETSDVREQHGKSRAGRVKLEVTQRGNEIVITVSDDGRGLNLQRIKQRAVERKIITAPEAAALTDAEAHMLIFQSGFTTSNKVTALSGRGLGMDIVRTRVENLRGRVSISSQSNRGTTIAINVPVSLTRLRVIVLQLGTERFAIPSVMVERMVTVAEDDIFTAEGQEMVTINERPMPLVSLANTLNVTDTAPRHDTIQVLALQTADRAVAFEIDDMQSDMEVVLKSLGRELENAPFVTGAALLGSGEIIIVLDANELVRRSMGMGMVVRQRLMARQPELVTRTRPRVLVVDDSITTRTLEKNILEAVGFEVFVAIDGVEAWQRIAELDPDVVVTDVEMPNMNGFELTRRIKNDETTKKLPVVLLTSLSKPEQRAEGLKAGADAYLVKTNFDQQELLETIQSLLP